MRQFKNLLLLLCLIFVGTAVAKSSSAVTSIEVKSITKGQVDLKVFLRKPAYIIAYYDNQKPTNDSQLQNFWFYKKSSVKRKQHTLRLHNILSDCTYYFRIEIKGKSSSVTKLLTWKILRPGTEKIKITNESLF